MELFLSIFACVLCLALLGILIFFWNERDTQIFRGICTAICLCVLIIAIVLRFAPFATVFLLIIALIAVWMYLDSRKK